VSESVARLSGEAAADAAEAAARSAAHLVRINLGVSPDDERIGVAETHAEAAAVARARALGS
jgi:hypothetical protein